MRMSRPVRKGKAVLPITCILILSLQLWASGKQGTAPAVPANQLVHEAVSHELKTQTGRTERFRYRMKKVAPEGSQIKEYVETDAGTVARLVAMNDKPLDPDVQSKEDARLKNLLANPSLQADRQKKQKEDEARVTRMVGALADAFNYEYDGNETGKNGAELIRLRFQPNPNYDPPTRELKVYQGMQGKMWIDATSHRMVRLEATLFRDVDFGWGILGRLYKGGHFDIEQTDIGAGRYETTYMNLDFTGKVMMLKSLKIRDTETLSDFHRIADNLTLAQGVEMLRSYEPGKDVVAQGAAPAPPRSQRK
jgi:hypothetical protein